MKPAFVISLATMLSASVVHAELKTNIEYGTAGGEVLHLDANVPDGAGPFPVVIAIHGGGWSRGDKTGNGDFAPALKPLTTNQFTWFSIDYRLAPTNHWPACFDDVETAIRWVKTHAAKYKGDPNRVALLGYLRGRLNGPVGEIGALRALGANARDATPLCG